MISFEPNKLLIYDEDSIVTELKRVYFNFFKDKQMPVEEFNIHSRVSYSTVIRHFGTWENALTKAEILFSKKTRKPKYDNEEIKSDIDRVKELNQDKYFTYTFYKQNNGKHDKKIIKRFGYKTWEELLNKELGLNKEYKKRKVILLRQKKESFSDEQLLNEIKIVWDKIGRRPTYGEFKNNSSIGISIFETRFRTWTGAIEQFCLKNDNYDSYNVGMKLNTSKELLLKELKTIKGFHQNEILEFNDYKKLGGKYTKPTFIKYLGSWKEALESVGLKPGSEWNKAPEKELLFEELQRVWEHLGRQPLYGEWNELSKYTRELYDRKFGGWNKTIHAFIADREKPEEEIVITNAEVENEIPPDNFVEIINPEKSNQEVIIIMKTPRGVSTRLRFRVFMRDNFTCQYCGRNAKDGVKLEADHKIAYSNGGETVLDNLVTACWDCNSGKSNLEL